jgi:hypothetical protein
MNDEYEPYPDVSDVLTQRLQQRFEASKNPPAGTVDPYQLIMQKKQRVVAEPSKVAIETTPIVKWPEAEIKQLQDYCTKMGIVGFNCGSMPPIVVLAMLKRQYGEDYTNIPLEDRIPEGYEKLGAHSPYGPNFTYSEAIKRKQILHG